jgi:hypothetical protein
MDRQRISRRAKLAEHLIKQRARWRPGDIEPRSCLANPASHRTKFGGKDLLRNVLTGFLLIATILGSVAYGAGTIQEKDAFLAAEKWLERIDKGEYAASWREAAEYFKTAITEEEWVQSLQAVRKPLGKLFSRKLQSLTPKTSLPNTPDGKYVVIKFETSFENKKSGLETVTPQLEGDGKWRVSGYHIKWQ